MSKLDKILLTIVVLSLANAPRLCSQELPPLSKAPEISTGIFANGISYYIVSNPIKTGFADFALVQKGFVPEDLTRKALASLEHFELCPPFIYLAGRGVGYTSRGYIDSGEDHSAVRLENVPIFEKSVCDSVCLMLFEMASLNPAKQAIVIAGDINAPELKERLSGLSLFTTMRTKEPVQAKFVWNPDRKRRIYAAQSSIPATSSLSITYSAPRPARGMMNTVQPLMNGLYANILGKVLRSRIEEIFRSEGIALESVNFSYRSAAQTPGEESYTLLVRSSVPDAERSLRSIAAILSDMSSDGVTELEYADAKQEELIEIATKSDKILNSQYVDKCISSYLYGSNLAPERTIKEFFATRQLDGIKELDFFNKYVHALISRDRNLTIRYDMGRDMDKERVAEIFDEAWNETPDKPELASGEKVDLFQNRKFNGREKLKLQFGTSEPITGGQFWVFSNGIEVVYKRVMGSERFHYAFMLRGGLDNVEDIAKGESAFVPDMLGLCDVAGLSNVDFANMLRTNGITMNTDVNLAYMNISGSAPSGSLGLLFNSILALARERKPDRQAFEYYKSCEKLRIAADRRRQEGLYAVMDSLMAPGYKYAPTKQMRGLQDNLPQRVNEYFDRRFEKFNDGVIVLIGDLDEKMLRKELSVMLAAFPTGKALSTRPIIDYPLHAGWSTYTIEAARSNAGTGEAGVNVAMSAFAPFSASRYMAFRLAKIFLEKQVISALAEMGMYAEVEANYDIFPVEKLNIYVTCRPCQASGLPEDIVPADPLRALGAVRSAISVAMSSSMDEKALEIHKSILLSEFKAEVEDPGRLVKLVLVRYSLGKDIVRNYKDKVKSVKAEDVKEVLRTLDAGAKVEYIIY